MISTPSDLKAACKKSMVEHLKQFADPRGNIAGDTIIRELPNMWIKLEAEGLTKIPGYELSYKAFADHAINRKNLALMRGHR